MLMSAFNSTHCVQTVMLQDGARNSILFIHGPGAPCPSRPPRKRSSPGCFLTGLNVKMRTAVDTFTEFGTLPQPLTSRIASLENLENLLRTPGSPLFQALYPDAVCLDIWPAAFATLLDDSLFFAYKHLRNRITPGQKSELLLVVETLDVFLICMYPYCWPAPFPSVRTHGPYLSHTPTSFPRYEAIHISALNLPLNRAAVSSAARRRNYAIAMTSFVRSIDHWVIRSRPRHHYILLPRRCTRSDHVLIAASIVFVVLHCIRRAHPNISRCP
ncbi:hypothetical protein C8Q80DRAFT_704483 [Daedaleopsis nitida]|nr:hypothetical protein C8Q80DRAFT_704483 [Daedaleopsis nitida]